MKIPKAIEILTDLPQLRELSSALDEPDAIKLGIEALKSITNARGGNYKVMWDNLPGEDPQ